MNMNTVIAVVALIAILAFVIRYIVKEKKKGTACIGCPHAGQCSSKTVKQHNSAHAVHNCH